MPLVQNRVEGADIFIAEGSIGKYKIVKPGTDKNTTGRQMVIAAAATDDVFGAIQNGLDAVALDQVRLPNIGENALVVLGGTVVVGDWLVSNGSGAGIAATPGAGVKCIGRAGQSGVSGQIIVYKHNPAYVPAS